MKLTIIVLLCSLLPLTITKLKSLSEEHGSLRRSISSCAFSAANELRNSNIIITVSLSIKNYENFSNSSIAMDQLLLQAFHKNPRWTILVKKSSTRQRKSKFFKKSDEYIIQIRAAEEFEFILKSLLQTKSWNPHARFIIISSTIFQEHRKVVAIIFEQLWKQQVIHAVVMLPRYEFSDVLNIYSWFPFRDGHCGKNYDRAFLINKCNNGVLQNQSVIFPEKIPRNMNNCPIKVRTIIWPPYVLEPKNYYLMSKKDVKLTKGIEIKLLNTVAEVAKFKILYSVSDINQDWGEIHRNGSATGMMKAVLEGEADIGIGAIASLNSRHRVFDTSVTYMWESVTWCIPHAMPIPKWKCLVKIFHLRAWIAIILTYMLISITIWIFSKKEKLESTSYKSVQSCFQNILSILLGLTVTNLPRVSKIRLITIIWIATSLNLNTAFTSSLIRELTEPSFEKQIKTIKQMIDHKFAFGLVPPSARFFSLGNEYYSEIKYWDSCDDVKICLDRTAYKRDYAVGIPRMYMQYASHKYVTTKGYRLLYWSKQDIVSYPVEMIMTKGFPLLRRINVLISRIKEAGLMSKWQYDFLEKVDNMTVPIDYDNDTDDVIFTTRHLEGAFILLGIGLAISAIVFVFEIIFKKRKTQRIQIVG